MSFDKRKDKVLGQYLPEEIGKYLRLSVEDREKEGGEEESDSISSQRNIINRYIDYNGNIGNKCKEFIDDGRTGTNFDRPGWNDLIKEIEKGKIKVVITKNLSRLGRSNYECGYYMEYYFPAKNIRYFTVHEGIDTGNQNNSSNEYAPINNFINEKFSRDLSKNIRSSKNIKQKQGEFVGSVLPYGYKRNPNDTNRFLIDDYPAEIVRSIYDWYIETQSKKAVIRKLFDKKILTPSHYNNLVGHPRIAKNPFLWSDKTITKILTSQTYIGNMVQHQTEKKSFREKGMKKIPKEEWIIVEGTHEPIIDKEKFDKVQNLIKANFKRNILKDKHPSELLRGLMVCYECKHQISIDNHTNTLKDGTKREYKYILCHYAKKNKNLNLCTSHYFNYYELEEKVLNEIENICKKYITLINYKKVTNQKELSMNDYGKKLEQQINKYNVTINNINQKIEKLYMDRLNDIITVDTFKMISEKFERERNDIKNKIDSLQKEYKQYTENNNSKKMLEAEKLADEYIKNRKKITRDFLLKIIDKIEIHEDKSIDIYLKIKPLEQIKEVA